MLKYICKIIKKIIYLYIQFKQKHMELNDKPYNDVFDTLDRALAEDMEEEASNNIHSFTISYPDSRKGYYKVIIKELEKDGWRATNGVLIGNEISVTFKKEIWTHL